MKCAAKTTMLAMTSLLLSAGAEAVTSDGPTHYQGIVERNVFNIHPPVTFNQTTETKKADIPKVTLNGITTILGRKVTFLTIPGLKPGAQPETLMLAEEQGQDDIEVRQIDEKAGVVKIVNHGEEQTLDFDHNGTKPSGPAPSVGSPMNFPPPIPAPPPAGVQPQNIIRPLRNVPMRPMGGMGGPSTSGGPAESGGPVSIAATQNQPDISPDDLDTLTETQRYQALKDNDPIAGILPPTAHTQEVIDSYNKEAAQ